MKRRRPGTLPPVLYEDDALVAFDKPSGLLTVPDRWNKSLENLMDIVHARLSPEIFNAHRLDREASGIVLCAKTRPALRALCRAFEQRQVKKIYTALVRGAPSWEERTVTVSLAPDRAVSGRMRAAGQGGKTARTDLRVRERWRGCALVEATPLTGRQHQIRVHLSVVGHPLLGDTMYGGGQGLFLSAIKPDYHPGRDDERPLIGRVALHAEQLEFPDPVSGRPLLIRAPEPHDFTVALKYLRRFAALSAAAADAQAADLPADAPPERHPSA